MTEKEKKQLLDLAKKYIYGVQERGDLETRNNDSEDFMDVAVWNIKALIEAAYQLGKEAK